MLSATRSYETEVENDGPESVENRTGGAKKRSWERSGKSGKLKRRSRCV